MRSHIHINNAQKYLSTTYKTLTNNIQNINQQQLTTLQQRYNNVTTTFYNYDEILTVRYRDFASELVITAATAIKPTKTTTQTRGV